MQISSRSFTTKHSGLANTLPNDVGVYRAFLPSSPPTKSSDIKKFRAIWDTGATNTVITERVVKACKLKPTGVTLAHTVGGTKRANTYLVSVFLPNNVVFGQLKVAEGEIYGQADVLIGMDIISQGDFAVTNVDRETTHSFRYPSVERIDFVEQSRKQRTVKAPPKVGRNDPCPCGSGKKYKHCCLNKYK